MQPRSVTLSFQRSSPVKARSAHWRCLVALLALPLCAPPLVAPPLMAQASSADALSQLIDNVAANEELYHDLEVKWVEQLRMDVEKFSETLVWVYQTRTYRGHMITQGDYLKYLSSEAGHTLNEQKQQIYIDNHFAVADDGRRRIEIAGSDIAIRHGTHPRREKFLPHTELILDGGIGRNIPLSVSLRGGEALRSHPFATEYHKNPKLFHSVVIEGEGEVDGLPTVRLRFEFGSSQENAHRLRIDLVPSRNYLPIRCEYYRSERRDLARGRISASDWRELAPGVWLAFRNRHVRYDTLTLLRKGIQQESSVDEGEILSASLGPRYPVDFFRALALPANATVYEYVDGKCVKKYRLNPWETLEGVTDSRRELWRWLTLSFGVAAVIVGLAWWRLRRQRRLSAALPVSH